MRWRARRPTGRGLVDRRPGYAGGSTARWAALERSGRRSAAPSAVPPTPPVATFVLVGRRARGAAEHGVVGMTRTAGSGTPGGASGSTPSVPASSPRCSRRRHRRSWPESPACIRSAASGARRRSPSWWRSLASDRASNTTGAYYVTDGGYTAQWSSVRGGVGDPAAARHRELVQVAGADGRERDLPPSVSTACTTLRRSTRRPPRASQARAGRRPAAAPGARRRRRRCGCAASTPRCPAARGRSATGTGHRTRPGSRTRPGTAANSTTSGETRKTARGVAGVLTVTIVPPFRRPTIRAAAPTGLTLPRRGR